MGLCAVGLQGKRGGDAPRANRLGDRGAPQAGMHEAAPERIAAAGRIDNLGCNGRFMAFSVGPVPPPGAAFAFGDDDEVDRVERTTRELAQGLVFELVDDDGVGEPGQLRGVGGLEVGEVLTRVGQEGDTHPSQGTCGRNHVRWKVGREDRVVKALGETSDVLFKVRCDGRPAKEPGELVLLAVGEDEGMGRVGRVRDLDA